MRQNLQKQQTEWTRVVAEGALTSQSVNSSVLGAYSP